MINAREEERRRLRRDLHDGLGPSLAGLSFRIDAARNLLKRDPQRADAQLEAAGDQLRNAIADIRRLVYGLRPPALDELGLVAALRQHFALLQPAHLQITLDAPEVLPPLPAAVEVAAYRIVQEAVNNVVRHASAQICKATLIIDDAHLVVTIADDGRGMGSENRAGVGMAAMRERAAELGGAFDVSDLPHGGVEVRARLPLHADSGPRSQARANPEQDAIPARER
ncbi:MAG: sensor histidine kinase [Caldilineaceae bacterium]